MRIHFIQHETFEAPGAYLSWAEARGCDVRFSKVYEGQPLPPSADGIDLLIVLGGPQSPDTTQQECAHFNAEAEKRLIKQCIDADKAVVGVCLGSQLIGEALGARYEHSPQREIGNFPVTFTQAGQKDEKFAHFGETCTVGHWHNDMPGLTANAEILACSQSCPRQIVRYSPLVYGLQCHAELTKEVVQLLIASESDLAQQSRQYQFVQSPAEIENYDYREMNAKLYGFLDKLAEEYRSR